MTELMLLQFRERNFILSLYGANLYGFVHRAFLEYFCATALLNKFEKAQEMSIEDLLAKVFGAHWPDQSWHEVLRLVCGMLAPQFASRVIDHLVAQRDISSDVYWRSGETPWHLALAVQCLGETRNPRTVAGSAEVLLRRTCELFDRDMRRPPRMFAFIKQHVMPAGLAIGAAWPRRDVLAELLDQRGPCRFAYIYDHIFGTFIGTIGRGSEVIRRSVLAYAESEQPEQRVLAPFALACGWGAEEDTFPRLRAMTEDEDQTVRYAALYAISEHYADHADTLLLLRLHALEGEFPFERAAALSGLAKRYGANHEVFGWLQERAITERDKFPRTAAIKGLGEYCRHEPETFELLLEIAVKDPSPVPGDERHAEPYYGREAALDSLARYWPSAPETVACLGVVMEADAVGWMRDLAGDWLGKLERRH
jgi:hypothetical protein